MGLQIHPVKSKVMQTVTKPDERRKVGEQELEEVDLFCYLGSTIDQEDGTAADVKAQIGKVTCNIYITQKVGKTEDISLHIN